MCGIFGIIEANKSPITTSDFQTRSQKLFKLSETRGREAAGVALSGFNENSNVYILKSNMTATKLMGSKSYHEFMNSSLAELSSSSKVLIGHTRLVTNGSQLQYENNQPVTYDNIVGIHNGIIVNVDELWEKYNLKRYSQVDTEIILALTSYFLKLTKSPITAVKKAFLEIKGVANCAIYFSDYNALILATNNGSLYYSRSILKKSAPTYFTSEKYILQKFLETLPSQERIDQQIEHISAETGVFFQLEKNYHNYFHIRSYDNAESFETISTQKKFKSINISTKNSINSINPQKQKKIPSEFIKHFQIHSEKVATLKRCNQCLLPETLPFISFNPKGICNHCQTHKPLEHKGLDELIKSFEPYRKPGSEPDCVMSISGGRDSCYALHYIVKELGIKPVTYTYDWGMVTDIARRNISRMCSSLGVENILISADIPKKRENIKKNVLAWLKKPHIGMVPLFMAGDKQFVWYGQKVKKQLGLNLDVFAMNRFELTQFKEEFSGIQFWDPSKDKDKLGHQMKLMKSFQLGLFYSKEFITNPSYLNRSLFDTFHGYVTYYVAPRESIQVFDYVPWSENLVDSTLTQYEWETAPDSQTTWRIGDALSPFYNYIYYMLAGFTENDTMRSNQLREGQITKEQAKALIERDNMPRWDSLHSLCETLNIDFESTIKTINKIKKLTPKLNA